MDWNKIPSDNIIEKTINSLKKNGIGAEVVSTKEDAKQKALGLIPEGSEVLEASSVTLEQLGLLEEIQKYGKYESVKKKLNSLNRDTHHLEMQKLGAAPQYVVGSVHAVTQDGKIVIASNTGSQLAPYAYGASHVIWIVSAKKITANLDEALKRTYEHVLPLESERVKKAYGMERSNVSKLLIINNEVKPNRIKIILVKEDLGY